ncbi:hypothetical protein NC651_039287 [Populus alba x Populus x berolinensis]|nr:hypothetical protein NC651_039287 [Populus alba x Populus x berolinensis]
MLRPVSTFGSLPLSHHQTFPVTSTSKIMVINLQTFCYNCRSI